LIQQLVKTSRANACFNLVDTLGSVWAYLVVALDSEITGARLESLLMWIDVGGGRLPLAKKAGWMLFRKVAIGGAETPLVAFGKRLCIAEHRKTLIGSVLSPLPSGVSHFAIRAGRPV
jgi:hypothetical protein